MFGIPLRPYVDNDLLYVTLWSVYGLPVDFGIAPDVVAFEPDTSSIETLLTDPRRGMMAQRIRTTGDDFDRDTLRIFHKYVFVDVDNLTGAPLAWQRAQARFSGDRIARAKRVQIKGSKCTAEDGIQIANLINKSTNLSQLHVNLRCATEEALPFGAPTLAEALERLLSSGSLDALRWSSNFLDIAPFFRNCSLRRLIWDTPRNYTPSPLGVAFPLLRSLDLTLSDNALHMPSNVLQWMLGATIDDLQTLVARSPNFFPSLEDFLHKHSQSLLRLRIVHHDLHMQAPCGPLHFLTRLRVCSLNVSTAVSLLQDGLPSVEELHIEGINRATIDLRAFRQRALRALQSLVDLLVDPRLFPCLSTLKLKGFSNDMFVDTEWYPIEEVRFAYCFNRLMDVRKRKRGEVRRSRKKMSFLTDDDVPLSPRGTLKRLTWGSFSYGYPVAGII
ncbi:hypothetical protein SCHPADRAFT_886210 [Schizopora paradoxa]|uniref:RNI-like protein n=1 Tax=Schizopora paradoxa TaxID=27342 RepID=A0A0H2S3F7_9AGAM|nr:hypothetical protein SCHPADRAFT_886210 [Schizopora paradoxa]